MKCLDTVYASGSSGCSVRWPDTRALYLVSRGPLRSCVGNLLQMLALRYMAIASFSRGSGSTPKLVALLANQEVQDEGGAQVGRFCHHVSIVPTAPYRRMPGSTPSYCTVPPMEAEARVLLLHLQIDPPGLYMVQLPFLDDIRHPETDPAWVGEGHPTPDQEAVDAAAEMIAALSLPDFFSGMLPNPSLQRHYQVCAARAAVSSVAASCEPGPSQTAAGILCTLQSL